ncbi:MAG TPA: oligosaccharide flippase family protein [Baekduia sp.]|nr:oligosaccharide flippase family protein [Baekduia sp.]
MPSEQTSETQNAEEPALTSPQPARLASNSAWTLVAQALAIAVNAVVSIMAIRLVATDAWGNYQTALSMIMLATFVADLGVATHTLREMSLAASSERPRLLGLGLSAIAQLGAVAAGATVLALGLGWNAQVAGLVLLALPLLFLTPALNLLSVPFNAARLMRYSATITVVQAVVLGVLQITGLLVFRATWVLVVATVLAAAIAAGVALHLLVRHLRLTPRRPESASAARRIVRSAVSLTLIGAIGTVYARLDILLLAQLASPSEVARYSVPFSIIQLAYMVPSLVGAAFFPLLAELLRTDPQDARSSMFRLQRLYFAMSVPAAFLLGEGAAAWLPAVFGPRYTNSVAVAEILAWTLVLTFQTYVLWYAVLATRRERGLISLLVVALIANLGLNLVLIPGLGAIGAAIALLVTDTLVIVGEIVYVSRRVVRLPISELGIKPVAAAAPAVCVMLLLRDVSPFGAALAASAAYLGGLGLSGYIRAEDLEPLIEPVSKFLRR